MKHILVTGGSRGIGAAAVRAFAKRGDDVTFFCKGTDCGGTNASGTAGHKDMLHKLLHLKKVRACKADPDLWFCYRRRFLVRWSVYCRKDEILLSDSDMNCFKRSSKI